MTLSLEGFQARPVNRLYRHVDGSFSDVSPANVGRSRPHCVLSSPMAEQLVSGGFYRVEEIDQFGASVLVQK